MDVKPVNVNTVPNTRYDIHKHCLCWSAIIAGALTALGLGFLLQLFGMAIGLSAYHADTQSAASTIALGGVIGLLIGVIVSMGVAGMVTGYLGHFFYFHPKESSIYGFLTWSIALLLSAVLIMPLAQYTSSYNNQLAAKVNVRSDLPQNLLVTQNQASANKANLPQTEVNVTPEALTGSFWLLFILFFVGALSSCIGVYCGMNCKRKHLEAHTEVHL